MKNVWKEVFAFLLLFALEISVEFPRTTAYHCGVISIDFGTTYSRVGVYWRDGFYENGTIEILANDRGNRMTPSVVAFTDDGILVGDAAKDQATDNPERTIFDVRRLIGRKYDDPDVQRDMKHLPYKVVNKDGKPYIEVNIKGENKLVGPEEVSSVVLRKLKEMAEAYTGLNVTKAAVTVPASFNDDQVDAVAEAVSMAGLIAYDIQEEPWAAAFAYGPLDNGGDRKILVYDLGGSTFDVTVLGFKWDRPSILATGGDPRLGGENFDRRVMDYFIKQIKIKYDRDISRDNRTLGTLRKECERAKRALSREHQVEVEIEFSDGGNFSELLTRARFEELNADLFNRTLGPVKKVLEDARLNETDIDQVFLVGGSSRIPMVQRLVKNFFGGKEVTTVGGPHKYLGTRESVEDVVPEEAVIYGATVNTYLDTMVHIDYDRPLPHDEL